MPVRALEKSLVVKSKVRMENMDTKEKRWKKKEEEGKERREESRPRRRITINGNEVKNRGKKKRVK